MRDIKGSEKWGINRCSGQASLRAIMSVDLRQVRGYPNGKNISVEIS